MATTGILERLGCGRKRLHAMRNEPLETQAVARFRREVIRMEGLHA
jgi:hypothetical protein